MKLVIINSGRLYQTCVTLVLILTGSSLKCVCAENSATGCTFNSGQDSATCDFGTWSPPLLDSQFSPGDVCDITIQNVNGNIPEQAFSGLGGPSGNINGRTLAITFQCSLENIILSPDTFTSNLDWVKTLTFQNCYIREGLPSNIFANLSALKTLNINSGIVGPLSDSSFFGLTNLKTLVINSDFLDNTLPDGLFDGLVSLQTLDLDTSGITSLSSGSFTGLSNLRTLDVSSNSLTSLPSGLFASLSKLTTVTLTSNAWDCTCDLAWLSTWALYSGVSIDVICATPSNYSGLTLNRGLLSLGCSSIYGGSEGSSKSDDDTARQYAYISMGIAGLACIISGILSCVLCYVCRNVRHAYPVTPSNQRYRQPKQEKTTQVVTISRNENRPSSYKSMDRLFVQSPNMGHKPKTGPYIDVDYRRNF